MTCSAREPLLHLKVNSSQRGLRTLKRGAKLVTDSFKEALLVNSVLWEQFAKGSVSPSVELLLRVTFKNQSGSARTSCVAKCVKYCRCTASTHQLCIKKKNSVVQWERNNGRHSEKSSRQATMKSGGQKTKGTAPYQEEVRVRPPTATNAAFCHLS